MTIPSPPRQRVAVWVESRPVQYFIVALILINAVTLGLETSASVMQRWGDLLLRLDAAILTVFVAEIALRLYGHGLRFFRDPWSLFDFTIVAVALIPASGPFAVLRSLRILRAMRLISMVPRLRFVVESLLGALPGIASIAALMLVLFYIGAVMSCGLFGTSHPEWFGSIGRAMYTLFQVMTLESWSMGIVRPLMQSHPYAWAFFIPFILIATFTILNLFIAIIVDTMQSMHEKAQGQEQAAIEATIRAGGSQVEEDLRALRQEVLALRRALEAGGGAQPRG
jgi:voltage-gated sodium channel